MWILVGIAHHVNGFRVAHVQIHGLQPQFRRNTVVQVSQECGLAGTADTGNEPQCIGRTRRHERLTFSYRMRPTLELYIFVHDARACQGMPTRIAIVAADWKRTIKSRFCVSYPTDSLRG